MNVVDSSAWLEYLGDGPDASDFAKAIENSRELVVPTLAIYEVFKKTVLLRGEAAGLEAVALMMQGRVVDASATLALEAARLSVAHQLPLADSFILATARAHRAILWTLDHHFEGLPDVQYRERRAQPRR
jgi:predicted nucleic acid-binding protein